MIPPSISTPGIDSSLADTKRKPMHRPAEHTSPWNAPATTRVRSVRAIERPRIGLGLHEHVYAFEVGPADANTVLATVRRFYGAHGARLIAGTAEHADMLELARGGGDVGVSFDERRHRHGIAVYLASVGSRGIAIRCRYWMRGFALYSNPTAFETESLALAQELTAIAPPLAPIAPTLADRAWWLRWAKTEYSALSSMPSVLPMVVGVLFLLLALPLVLVGGQAAAYLVVGTLRGGWSTARLHGLTTALLWFLALPLISQGLRSLRRRPRSPGFSAWLALTLATMASLAVFAIEVWLSIRRP